MQEYDWVWEGKPKPESSSLQTRLWKRKSQSTWALYILFAKHILTKRILFGSDELNGRKGRQQGSIVLQNCAHCIDSVHFFSPRVGFFLRLSEFWREEMKFIDVSHSRTFGLTQLNLVLRTPRFLQRSQWMQQVPDAAFYTAWACAEQTWETGSSRTGNCEKTGSYFKMLEKKNFFSWSEFVVLISERFLGRREQ